MAAVKAPGRDGRAGQRLGHLVRALPRGDARPRALLPRAPGARGCGWCWSRPTTRIRRAEVARVLASARASTAPAFIKSGNDMAFIDALDPQWNGALPATFLFDGRGTRRHSWLGPVTYQSLRSRVVALLSPADKNPEAMTNRGGDRMKLAPCRFPHRDRAGAAAAAVGRERAAAWRWGRRCPPQATTKMKNVDGKSCRSPTSRASRARW